jgi:outer membrane lipoprotein-sorting protein
MKNSKLKTGIRARLTAAFFIFHFSLLIVRAADTNAVLNAWLSAQTNLHTWTADFTQTRSLKALTQPLTATGKIWFAVPNRFRWEITAPGQTIALREADQLFVIYPQLKRAERYPLTASAPAEWREALALLDAGFPRDRADFLSRFRILALVETNGVWQFTLQPTSTFARRMMTEIGVSLATNDYSLVSNELVFVDGSRMRNDFTNAVLNARVDESLLQWKPPPDFKITEPLGK